MVKVTLHVIFKSGDPVPNCQVSGEIVQRVLSGERRFGRSVATTDQTGSAILEIDTSRVIGLTMFEFSAETVDASGVFWTGKARVTWQLVRVLPNQVPPYRRADVTMTRKRLDVAFRMDYDLRTCIAGTPFGNLVLSDIDELLDALEAELPSASLALVGEAIDGLIKVKARSEGWWISDWDELPLGALMDRSDVKRRIIEAVREPGWDRLKALGVTIRNIGAHQVLERVSMEEAQAATRVLFDFIPRWWNRAERPGQD